MDYTIDLQKMTDELDFDLEEVEMLLGIFLDSTKKSLNKLEEAIQSGEMKNISHLAHSIKGSAANLRLTDIYNLSKEIENESHLNRDIDYQRKFKELKELINGITT